MKPVHHFNVWFCLSLTLVTKLQLSTCCLFYFYSSSSCPTLEYAEWSLLKQILNITWNNLVCVTNKAFKKYLNDSSSRFGCLKQNSKSPTHFDSDVFLPLILWQNSPPSSFYDIYLLKFNKLCYLSYSISPIPEFGRCFPCGGVI